MEFHEKLQQLRKQKGLTQEALAQALYVSRTAVSKWESGKGYPGIDSLKAISALFGVSIDQLLSGDELLTIAREDTREKENHVHDLVFGLLDCSTAMFFFLPFFGQTVNGQIQSVPLPGLTALSLWLKAAYFAVVAGAIAAGLLTLALQNSTDAVWVRRKRGLSLGCNTAAVFLFVLSRQPYAAAFSVLLLIIKALLLKNKQ